MVIIIILFLGLVLRLINLNQSLWLDEAVQAITSQGSLANLFIELKGDFHPPLYHLFMWLWVHSLGSNEIILRLPSVLFGLVTVYIVYLIAQEIYPKRNIQVFNFHFSGADLAALLMATAPFHIYYSQEARLYAVSTFLASLSMYFFIKSFVILKIDTQKKDKLLQFGYVLSTLALLYTDYYGVLILLAQNLASFYLAKFNNKNKPVIDKWWQQQLAIILLFLPLFPFLMAQFHYGFQVTRVLPEWGKLINTNFVKAIPLTFIKFIIGRIAFFNKRIYALITVFLFLIYSLVLTRGTYLKKKMILPNFFLIILFWLLFPIFIAWFISFFVPNYQPFRLLLVLPAFYLLTGWGIISFSSIRSRIILTGIVLGVSLISLSNYYLNPYFQREDWRSLVSYLDTQTNKSAMAILPSQTSFWPYAYYSKGKVPYVSIGQGVLGVTENNLITLEEKLNNNQKVFFIRYLVPLFDPHEKIDSWLKNKGFVKMNEISFNQLLVWEYSLYRKEI